MGNSFQKPAIKCDVCAQNNTEPEYFTRKPVVTLIGRIDEERYDKYGNKIIDTVPKRTGFGYVCSNGHTIS